MLPEFPSPGGGSEGSAAGSWRELVSVRPLFADGGLVDRLGVAAVPVPPPSSPPASGAGDRGGSAQRYRWPSRLPLGWLLSPADGLPTDPAHFAVLATAAGGQGGVAAVRLRGDPFPLRGPEEPGGLLLLASPATAQQIALAWTDPGAQVPRDAEAACLRAAGHALARAVASWRAAAPRPWRLRSRMLVLDCPRLMGILNVTPDSFSDGGRYCSPAAAVARALELEAEGADILDIGGESTRPGARPVPAEEEIARVRPVFLALAGRLGIPISIDTTKASVARVALDLGAEAVNDVSALRHDPEMASCVAAAGAGLVLMHMLGTPQTMQQAPAYEDPVGEVLRFLDQRVAAAVAAGIDRESLAVDPGIGFGKRLGDNLALLAGLGELRTLGAPVLVGLSRKSFIGQILDLPHEERLEGTLAATTVAVLTGADILRVHDVRAGRRAARVAWEIARASRP